MTPHFFDSASQVDSYANHTILKQASGYVSNVSFLVQCGLFTFQPYNLAYGQYEKVKPYDMEDKSPRLEGVQYASGKM